MPIPFNRSHDIRIEAPPEAVFDYVCNPNSWPKWLAASHRIDSADRALKSGETFREQWHIRRGEVVLNWTVTESERPNAWTVEADTDFIGPIVIRYTFEREGEVTKYMRHLSNPRRPSAPSDEQIQRMDEEAVVALANIKRQVEQMSGPSSMNARITVRVDRDKCQGHARCYALAPQLFELDQLGNATEKSRSPVPIEFEDNAFMAQSNCPEGAIIIEGRDATSIEGTQA